MLRDPKDINHNGKTLAEILDAHGKWLRGQEIITMPNQPFTLLLELILKLAALIAAMAFALPAYAETASNGGTIYTALLVDYDGELTGLGGSLVFTEYSACIAAMNGLRNDVNHQAYESAKCTRFIVAGGQVALYENKRD